MSLVWVSFTITPNTVSGNNHSEIKVLIAALYPHSVHGHFSALEFRSSDY